jgi:pantoate--beta-alanine ligase
MKIAHTISQLRSSVYQWRKQGKSIAFVPTMGNLHAGHIKLVSEARKKADKVVVSIFVNPTQFGVGEDFENYPRTETQDQYKLAKVPTDMLFLPSIAEMYPQPMDTIVSVTELAQHLCGQSRPTHFNGVATVVSKLFNIVQPDMAFFGEKDFQQLTIIRKVVSDLNMPIEIVAVKTEREADGLAMSSRNVYLTTKERKIAPQLYMSLCHARNEVLLNKQSLRDIEIQGQKYLEGAGFIVDYFSICKSSHLQPAQKCDNDFIVLVAARLGKPRLIDNIYFSR